MIARLAFVGLLAPLLGGCMQTLSGSIPGGESKIFERPPYVVLGKTKYDQGWIDSQVEGGVAAFGWKRPAARPASLNASPTAKAARNPKQKPNFAKRFKDRVLAPLWPAKGVVPIDPTPAPSIAIAPAPPPRDAVDELLHPSNGVK